MIRRKIALITIIFLIAISPLFVMNTVNAQTWTNITTLPYTISSSGNYRLIGNISGTGTNLITINNNNVVLDGQNFFLIGNMNWETDAGANGIKVNSGKYGIEIRNIGISETFYCIYTYSNNYNFTISNCTLYHSGRNGIYCNNAHDFIVQNSYFSWHDDSGVYFIGCYNFAMNNCTIKNTWGLGYPFDIENSNTFSITNVLTDNSTVYGAYSYMNHNYIISNCTFNGNGYYGIIVYRDYDGYLTDSTFSNNLSNGVRISLSHNINTTNCNVLYNGYNSYTSNTGGFYLEDNYDININNNSISNNYDAIYWIVTIEDVYVTNIFDNNFLLNRNTLNLDYQCQIPPVDYWAELNFYNNLVNDSVYFDMNSPIHWISPYIDNSIIHLNTTETIGTRIYSDGNLGGNYWTHPDIIGISDSGTETGFAQPLDLIGNSTIYDYLPYSWISLTPTPTIEPTPSTENNIVIGLVIAFFFIVFSTLFLFMKPCFECVLMSLVIMAFGIIIGCMIVIPISQIIGVFMIVYIVFILVINVLRMQA